MQYRNYGKMGYQVSALGMGCMRLPRMENNETVVDREKAYEMIRYAVDNGVTYFDSAHTYHNKTSEEILGEALEGGRREKVKIATKQGFNTMADLNSGGGKTIHENMRRNLESTLKKLRTGCVDVYLIHGINITTWERIKQNKILEEYEKFRSEGLIRGIAFSYHGKFPCFKEVLESFDWSMCQIQQNFLDIDKEATEEAIRLAGKKGCAMVVMEPLRGGSLSTPPKRVQAVYDEYPVKRNAVEWAFRHVLDYPEVSTVLSGMSTMEQIKENIEIFSKPDAVPGCVTPKEREILGKAKLAYESVKNIPCTGCEYCLPCPKGVSIPRIFSRYNDGNMFENFSQSVRNYSKLIDQKKDAAQCAECGECEKKCPQHIEVIKQLKVAHEAMIGWMNLT